MLPATRGGLCESSTDCASEASEDGVRLESESKSHRIEADAEESFDNGTEEDSDDSVVDDDAAEDDAAVDDANEDAAEDEAKESAAEDATNATAEDATSEEATDAEEREGMRL